MIIHKIDRSARNLRDWADLGELIDRGVEVHFANESLDLHSRGGRLSADIQAVVAADYIRNLREETIKGFWGRLKQGLFPMPAPLGYVNNGAGKPKTLDPKTAPLVRKAFDLYSTGRYNLSASVPELNRLGLRRRGGNQLHPNRMSELSQQPFLHWAHPYQDHERDIQGQSTNRWSAASFLNASRRSCTAKPMPAASNMTSCTAAV